MYNYSRLFCLFSEHEKKVCLFYEHEKNYLFSEHEKIYLFSEHEKNNENPKMGANMSENTYFTCTGKWLNNPL